MHNILLFLTCVIASVSSHYNCDYPSFTYDFPTFGDYPDFGEPPPASTKTPPTRGPPQVTTQRQTTRTPGTTGTVPLPVTSRPTPPHVGMDQRQTTRTLGTTSTEPLPVTSRPTPPRVGMDQRQTTRTLGTTSTEPLPVTSRPTPPNIPTVATDVPSLTLLSRVGEDVNGLQRTQTNELNCLDVLDRVITEQWQNDIDKLSVSDLGNFSTSIEIPMFSSLYSNPESEWIQEEEMHLNKLDKCVRNLVSKVAPRLNPEEIACLNKIYPDYMSKEGRTAKSMEKLIMETSREQLPFRSFYSYFELTEILFDNRNIEALDDEQRAVHEDALELYIKTEEDKSKKIFVLEQECEWKNARLLREVGNDDVRYQRFGELIKSHVNTYLVSEILHKWAPGATLPEFRYNLWMKARTTMENEILERLTEVRRDKRDAQFLCTYAAQLATKFFLDQKEILFEKMKNTTLSSELRTHEKYSYVVALERLLVGKSDSRLSRVEVLVKEFKEGHYCLADFIRVVEHHQRYMIASALVNVVLPYGQTYCLVKEMSAGLINPRYCKCQGTFCESFGMATLRAERYQLNLLPNNTYTVTTNSSYRVLPLDELVANANQRIAGQKFNTWWYRQQQKKT